MGDEQRPTSRISAIIASMIFPIIKARKNKGQFTAASSILKCINSIPNTIMISTEIEPTINFATPLPNKYMGMWIGATYIYLSVL